MDIWTRRWEVQPQSYNLLIPWRGVMLSICVRTVVQEKIISPFHFDTIKRKAENLILPPSSVGDNSKHMSYLLQKAFWADYQYCSFRACWWRSKCIYTSNAEGSPEGSHVLITFFICCATLVNLRSKSFESLKDIFPGEHTSRLM